MKLNSFKAAVLYKINTPLKIIDCKFPSLKKGQVLVKNLYSGICRSQIMEIDGLRGIDNWLPHLLGHEGVGEVIQIGKGVSKVKKGDTIISSWIQGEGLDVNIDNIYSTSGEKINSGKITTFSEFSIISENRLFRKPKNISIEIASLLGCAIPTGCGKIFNLKKRIPYESKILVFGLGGIGLLTYLALKSFGYKNLYFREINKNKINLVQKYLDGKNGNNFDNFDFIFESAGLTSTIEESFSLLKKDGTLYFSSHPDSSRKISINPHELISGKNIYGVWGGMMNMDKQLNSLTNKIYKDLNNIKSHILNYYEFKDINKAISDLKNNKVVRPIIKF